MIRKILHSASAAFVLLLITVGISSCSQAQGSKAINYGNGPRKPVPPEAVGTWTYTGVSATNMVDNKGHSAPAWSRGVVYHINADGTGFCVVFSNVTTYSAPTSAARVDCYGTYEIELTEGGEGMILKFYTANGKVYQNEKYQHDLVKEKLWPATFDNYKVSFGENSNGKYFESNGMRFFKS